jgi:hypothetical protein
MRFFSMASILSMTVVGVAALAACTGEVEPQYGPPGGLRNAHLPDPTGTTTGGADSGTPPPSDGGGGDVVTMNCTVSFKQQIYPKMQSAGTWKCAGSACHGAPSPPSVAISATDATAAYNALKGYVINGKAYFNPASTDPAQSSFECNLKGACGAQIMPPPPGTPATTQEIADVDTWVKCGAPNN